MDRASIQISINDNGEIDIEVLGKESDALDVANEIMFASYSENRYQHIEEFNRVH